MKKNILLSALAFAFFTFSGFSKDKAEYSVTSSGASKSESLAKAIGRISYGSEIKRVHFNGYEVRTKDGVVRSNFKCRLIVVDK
jgi:hypothetical protein